MFTRMLDWASKIFCQAVAKRFAQQVSEWSGEEVEEFDVTDVKALPAPKRK